MKVMLLDQQVYGLPGDHHRTDGVAGLGGADLQFSLAAPDGFADGYAFLLQIQVSPEKGKQFSPAQAAGQFQIKHRKDIAVCCGLEVCTDLFRLDDLHLFPLQLGRITAIGGIFLDEALLYRLLQGAV